MCAAFMQRGSPIRLGANAQQAKTKIIVMELFSHIGLNDWTDGSLIQWVPQNMLETRVGAETEKGLINFGNLIANDVTKWPVYKHNLEQCKSKDKSFAYERPTSPTNWTSFTNIVNINGKEVSMEAPGTWTMAVSGSNVEHALTMNGDVITHAFLNDHWVTNRTTKTLTKQRMKADNSGPWVDAMQLVFAPRGSFNNAEIQRINAFMAAHPYILWELQTTCNVAKKRFFYDW
jgi:hypothetical protein